MAKLLKFSGYYVDPLERTSVEAIKHYLEHDFTAFIPHHIHVKAVDVDLSEDSPLHRANCDLMECEQYFTPKPSDPASSGIPKVGSSYRHFKGAWVTVLAISQDTEHPSSFAVVYQNLQTGRVWHRPLAMFMSEVNHEKYPAVTQKYRFELIKAVENESKS